MEVHTNHEAREVLEPLLVLAGVPSEQIAVLHVPDKADFELASVVRLARIIM